MARFGSSLRECTAPQATNIYARKLISCNKRYIEQDTHTHTPRRTPAAAARASCLPPLPGTAASQQLSQAPPHPTLPPMPHRNAHAAPQPLPPAVISKVFQQRVVPTACQILAVTPHSLQQTYARCVSGAAALAWSACGIVGWSVVRVCVHAHTLPCMHLTSTHFVYSEAFVAPCI